LEIISYIQQMWLLATSGDTQGVWFFAALYIFIVATYSVAFQLYTRSWPCTQGALLNLGSDEFGASFRRSDQNYVTRALYRYRVGGTDYEGHRLSPWVIVASHNARFVLRWQRRNVQPTSAGCIGVYYNPRNPKKSYLKVAGRAGICFTMLLALLPLLSFYLRYDT
jgi:hypothetical protein